MLKTSKSKKNKEISYLLRAYYPLILIILICSCNSTEKENTPPQNQAADIQKTTNNLSNTLFQLIAPEQSKVNFTNQITESFEANLINHEYIYAGAGIALGDINNDGLPDLFCAGNMVPSKLYLNLGNFEFKDITAEAGIKSEIQGWASGVTFADLNQDGHLDIYICKGSDVGKVPAHKKNLLYINNGNLTFTEKAEEFQLAGLSPSIQAAPLDYDLDGDLDLYVVNHPPAVFDLSFSKMNELKNNPGKKYELSSDRLYRNDGNGKFTDVSKKTGIMNWGYGLGVVVSDINNDNWPDVYVANDYEIESFYYENNRDGTFSKKTKENFGHVSFYAMGVDAADINNDLLVDIYEVEMLPQEHKRSKVNMKPMNLPLFNNMIGSGMHYQYMRNSLQLNTGNGYFSEIAQFSNTDKTDWSWGTVIADLDDDGWKDIFVANGILRDMKDRDYTQVINKISKENKGITIEQILQNAPSTPVANYAFKNNTDLTFENKTKEWGLDLKGFSNSLAYGDLDKDGDLDLVIGNLNHPITIYKNTASQKGKNYLNIELEGEKNNPKGIGTKVILYENNQTQLQELYPVRGFQSCSETIIHFGLGKASNIDSIIVKWPDQRTQKLTNVSANQLLKIKYKDSQKSKNTNKKNKQKYFEEINTDHLAFKHQENTFNDFKYESLLPHKLSQLGPKIAVGDINNDGLEDFHIGGAESFAGAIFLQNKNGKFNKTENPHIKADSPYEDIASCFFDADNDNDLDLYVVSGSNEFPANSKAYQDRLYLNNGNGNFVKKEGVLPNISSSGSCVIPSDWDNDGDLDLFIGGRLTPTKYPLPSQSYLLRNDGGQFTDVSNQMGIDLSKLGMVTDAIWSDIDNDKDNDLIIVGEWMSINVFENQDGKFKNISNQMGLEKTRGWWFSIEKGDFNKDGKEDFIVGNIGLNHKFKAKKDKPFHVYCNDFDQNGSIDIVLANEYKDGSQYPVRGRDCSSEQMPFISTKFPSFNAFASANLDQIYSKDKLSEALHYEAQNFASIMLINKGSKFEIVELPKLAQFSPVNGIIVQDFTGNGYEDVLLAGNMVHTEPETSRADAGVGLFLANEKGTLSPQQPNESGFFVANQDVKDLKLCKNNANNQDYIILGINNNAPRIFKLNK